MSESQVTTIKVGLLPPTKGADAVATQMQLGRKYYNQLKELHNWHVRSKWEIKNSLGLAGIEHQIAQLQLEEKLAVEEIQNVKGRNPESLVAARENVHAIRNQLKSMYAVCKAESNRLSKTEKYKNEISKLKDEYLRRDRELRAASGLYWGTYQHVEAAIKQAVKSVNGGILEFSRWEGTGCVAIHCQRGGLPAEELFADNFAVQIDPVPEKAYDKSVPRGERRRLCRTTLRMRVDPEGTIAEWPMILHRPIPKGAICTWVRVHRDKDDRLSCCIVLKNVKPKPKARGKKSAVITMCPKYVDTGARVATLLSNRGETEEIIFPEKILGGLAEAEHLQGIRSKSFNKTLEKLKPWVKKNKKRLPKWFLDQSAGIHSWKSYKLLSSLVATWRDNRFPGDTSIFGKVENWFHRERHLSQWELGQRRRVRNQREDFYKKTAARIADQYSSIEIITKDFASTLSRSNVSNINKALLSIAPYSFQVILENAVKTRQGSVKIEKKK